MKEYKKILIIGILFISLIGEVIFLWLPWIHKVKDKRDKIYVLESKISQLEEVIKQTERLKLHQEEIRKELEKLSKAIPEEDDIPFLLIQFETLASMNSLMMDSINFSKISADQSKKIRQSLESKLKGAKAIFSNSEEKSQKQTNSRSGEGFDYLQAEITLSGSYSSFKKYLEALEKNLRTMDIISISFNSGSGRSKGANTSDLMEYHLRIKIYYLKTNGR